MSFPKFLKSLFIETGSSEPKMLTLDEIRRRIFETSRNMEMRNREAAAAEQKAQAALQKTFQPGVGAAQRTKLLAEHQRCLKEAKSFIGFANQLGGVLETLETAETFMELSETISQSNIAGAGKMDIKEIMKELQETGQFVYDGITWRKIDADAKTIHVRADIDRTEMWISTKTELPFIMKMKGNPLGIDWEIK